MPVEVRRSADRFVTEAPGRTTRHSFSFDRHYDPGNVAMGFLVCLNDDRVEAGHGYPAHPHRELEILTWVLDGALRHEDSTGRGGVVTPGVVQRLCAGTGVVHTELAEGTSPVRFVQMWLTPGESGLAPAYSSAHVDPAAGWVPLAAGRGDAAVPLSNAGAALHVAELAPGEHVRLPDAPLLHLFVARGSVQLEGSGGLGEGDAARMYDDGGRRVTTSAGAELLLWEMHASAFRGRMDA